MPLFGYACRSCGKFSELLVRNSEEPVCPECQSPQLEKQLSHVAPLHARQPEPAGCGVPQCCRMQDGGCMN